MARVLLEGVYIPVYTVFGSRLIARVCVFVVSGLGHTYALNCTQQPLWMQASMMGGFLVQLPLLAVEEACELAGSKTWLQFALFVTSFFFVEPLLAVLEW